MAEGECVNVLCLKWGRLYSADYVNRLYRGVKANLARPFRFVCVTDDPTGLDAGIDAEPFPDAPPGWTPNRRYAKWPNIYVKLLVFRKGFAHLEGPTLFLDIDQIVTGRLDDFFDYEPGRFCIIRNWIELRKRLFRRLPKIGNSSCFRFEAGSDAADAVYRKYLSEIAAAMDPANYRTEQAYMTHAVGLGNIRWWPDGFVSSFKRSCARPFPFNLLFAPQPPKMARILCFHGHPSPDEAIAGYRGRHLNTWVRPCPWVAELWDR